MPKYACPRCGSSMMVRSNHGRCFISCTCGVSHVLPDNEGEPNIVFLKFLNIIDKRAEPTDIKTPESLEKTEPEKIKPEKIKLKKTRQKTKLEKTEPKKIKPEKIKLKKTRQKSKPKFNTRTSSTTTHEPPPAQTPNHIHGTPQESTLEITTAPKCRPKSDIYDMIKGKNPDKTVCNILFTENYYICQYTVSDSLGPEPGDAPHNLTMNSKLAKYLESVGISRLHKFQQESYDIITGGRDVIISAPTASGKTESFLIPIIQMASEIKSPMFALIIYPTKALARDQLIKIQAMAASVGVSTAIFDGDTPDMAKNKILKSPPHILVTNFDTINYHLPRQTRLANLLYSIRILVVDEVHAYHGVFGSNIHHLIKRLDRVCIHILQMVAASATISGPLRFCSALLDRDMELVETDQRRGRIDTIMMSAPTDKKQNMVLDVTRQFISQKHKTLVFSNSHRSAELISINAKRNDLDIRVHRSGIPLQDRHKAEDEFKNGDLMAISCTPTLELGIDIGVVDGVVSSLVPVNRLLQRVGRAARRQRRGYAILALGDDPISQYYKNNPEDYFEDFEVLYIDPTNPIVQEYHVAAMSLDAPLHINDVHLEHRPAVQRCVDAGLVQNRDGNIIPIRDKIHGRLREYNIRGTGESIRIMINGRPHGTRSLPMALTELYRGATYYMSGLPYEVIDLDISVSKTAHLKGTSWHRGSTRPEYIEKPTITKIHDTKTIWNTQIAHCTLKIRMIVSGYRMKNIPDVISLGGLHLYNYITKGLVFCAPPHKTSRSNMADIHEDMCHTVEHVIRESGNMLTGGIAQDVGGISLGCGGAIFVYDAAIGGNGATKTLYDKMELVIERSAQILRLCPCKSDSGCPRCTYSYRCGNNNSALHKLNGLSVLDSIMSGNESRLEDVFGSELYDK